MILSAVLIKAWREDGQPDGIAVAYTALSIASRGKNEIGNLKKVKKRIAVNGFPSHSYGTSLAIWDHTVLPATRHKWTCHCLALTPAASKLVLDLPTPEGWKAELTLATRQWTGRESNSRSLVRRPIPLHYRGNNNERRRASSILEVYACSCSNDDGMLMKLSLQSKQHPFPWLTVVADGWQSLIRFCGHILYRQSDTWLYCQGLNGFIAYTFRFFCFRISSVGLRLLCSMYQQYSQSQKYSLLCWHLI